MRRIFRLGFGQCHVRPQARLLVVLTRPVPPGDSRALAAACCVVAASNQGTLLDREQMSTAELVHQYTGDTRYWAKQGIVIVIIVLLVYLSAFGGGERSR